MNMDDDWLEDTSHAGPSTWQGGAEDPLVERQWDRLQTRYTDAGYREGITPGKLSTLQEGFDHAFAASVPASRMLGYLRGQASSLLAYAQSFRDAVDSPLVSEIRGYLQSLAQVKRTDILPPDKEAEEHAKQDHGGDGDGFTTALDEETLHKRDLEGLEAALAGLGGAAQPSNGVLREQALLDSLQTRLAELKAACGL